MAERGDFGYNDPALDNSLDNDGDINVPHPDEGNRTGYFTPYSASTPYHHGEQYEMQTMMHEQSGLPSFDERVPLLSPDKDAELTRKLANLRYDSHTGLLDITNISKAYENISGEDYKEEQIKRLKNFIKKMPMSTNWLLGTPKQSHCNLCYLDQRAGKQKFF